MVSEVDRIKIVYEERRKRLEGRDTYSLFNPGHLYMVQQRQREVLSMLRHEGFYPLAHKRILEIGCGDGGVLRELLSYGASPRMLAGIDLLRWRIQNANHETFSMLQADGQRLPYLDASFEMVVQFTMFTSILDQNMKRVIAGEMLRVLKPEGLILWYDYWLNPINRNVHGMRIPEIRSMFPNCSFVFRRITLAPPITRFLAKYSWIGCQMLESLRLLNTHYLAAIRPDGDK